jgi:hypothetical protein
MMSNVRWMAGTEYAFVRCSGFGDGVLIANGSGDRLMELYHSQDACGGKFLRHKSEGHKYLGNPAMKSQGVADGSRARRPGAVAL